MSEFWDEIMFTVFDNPNKLIEAIANAEWELFVDPTDKKREIVKALYERLDAIDDGSPNPH